ncbi:hypothetical protein BDK51DRAFT_39042 [Blyttiomyces helicus]|uniref:Transmembrane protein n=1 Tax=Blyttiomyces helicus TaxID=388810 RepID=A0A4P9WP48_9FUNG|nr:hypothetical protein BDK51DRAFT_39042 [Blyttiomyces helicus]|eukprot:RKO93498.1 hypothetical protein BDK51DRAFT_39042 [Blyttiomyces helicus]
MARSLISRPLDLVFVFFFVSHIPATILVDGQERKTGPAFPGGLPVLFPATFFPEAVRDALRTWVALSGDPFMTPVSRGEPALAWFTAIVAAEWAVQLPMFFYLIWGLGGSTCFTSSGRREGRFYERTNVLDSSARHRSGEGQEPLCLNFDRTKRVPLRTPFNVSLPPICVGAECDIPDLKGMFEENAVDTPLLKAFSEIPDGTFCPSIEVSTWRSGKKDFQPRLVSGQSRRRDGRGQEGPLADEHASCPTRLPIEPLRDVLASSQNVTQLNRMDLQKEEAASDRARAQTGAKSDRAVTRRRRSEATGDAGRAFVVSLSTRHSPASTPRSSNRTSSSNPRTTRLPVPGRKFVTCALADSLKDGTESRASPYLPRARADSIDQRPFLSPFRSPGPVPCLVGSGAGIAHPVLSPTRGSSSLSASDLCCGASAAGPPRPILHHSSSKAPTRASRSPSLERSPTSPNMEMDDLSAECGSPSVSETQPSSPEPVQPGGMVATKRNARASTISEEEMAELLRTPEDDSFELRLCWTETGVPLPIANDAD